MVPANAGRAVPIEIARVGDPALPHWAALDPDILIWAKQQDQVVVSKDVGPAYDPGQASAGRAHSRAYS